MKKPFEVEIGHGVSNDLLQRTLSVTRQLFDLDLQIKNQYAARLFLQSSGTPPQTGGLGRGYQSVGENVTNTKRDRHEGFDLYRELGWNHPLRLQFDEKNVSGRKLPDYRDLAVGWNPWPKELPQFREIINEYTAAMLEAGARVMRGIALSLDLPLNYFESTLNDSFWVIHENVATEFHLHSLPRSFDASNIQLFLPANKKPMVSVTAAANIPITVG